MSAVGMAAASTVSIDAVRAAVLAFSGARAATAVDASVLAVVAAAGRAIAADANAVPPFARSLAVVLEAFF